LWIDVVGGDDCIRDGHEIGEVVCVIGGTPNHGERPGAHQAVSAQVDAIADVLTVVSVGERTVDTEEGAVLNGESVIGGTRTTQTYLHTTIDDHGGGIDDAGVVVGRTPEQQGTRS